MGHWMFSFVYHPPNPPLSELFPCLAGMQLNQRATCALRCPECLSGGLSHCENEQNQRRNICVSLERERIRRPKKNVTILALGIWLCTSRHPFCLMQDRAISTGKPSQTWSPSNPGEDKMLCYCWQQAVSSLRVVEQGWTLPLQNITLLYGH